MNTSNQIDERYWPEVTRYPQAEFELSLQVLTLCRAELVAMLRQTAMEDWGCLGNYEIQGTISLLQVATSLLEHEEAHCVQLEAL